jgi:hypothetical protein
MTLWGKTVFGPRLFGLLTIFALVLGLAVVPAKAQTSTAGTVAGQVTDESGAAVPGAVIKLTDLATNEVVTTVSNEAGRYTFPIVPPGKYDVTFTKEGFTTYDIKGQGVDVGMALTLNASLKIGSTSTTVEVSASIGAELQTMNATVGNTLSGRSLLVLPNLGRDVTSMAVLQPATTPGGQTAGSPRDLNTYQLDGANVSDDMGGDVITYQTNYSGLGGSQGSSIPSGVIPTPIESIEEFKVSVSNQTSDFNNSSGGQIQMTTKRGTNQFHGAGYMFYFDNAVGEANSWTNNHTPFSFGSLSFPDTPVDFPKNHRSRFGGAIGGPLIPKPFLGGKWYFFFNVEALRFPNAQLFQANTPSALLREGVIQIPNAAGAYIPYNLTNSTIMVNGSPLAPAVCPAGACDPRGLGLNPIVNDIWSQQMPLENNPLGGDGFNSQGFLGSLREPLTSNNYVGRIDHDFSDKQHFYVSYRDFKLVSLTGNQVDIGGVLPGDKLGIPAATAPRPQQPSVWIAGLTSIINPTTTNAFVFSYLRQFWQWSDDQGPAQGFGLGGALEIGGENGAGSDLIPYNVNSQSVRQRFWDGHDTNLRDDISLLKGNHMFTFGGAYAHNWDYHSRTDNGAGVNDQISYLSTAAGLNFTSPSVQYIPTTVPSSQYSNYEGLYSELLGIVSSTQVMYTRAGQQLSPLPIGTAATDKSTIPYYSVYWQDSWHVKPSFTLTYGLGWNLEMPPVEQNGKQVELVDSNNEPVITSQFLAERQAMALAGGNYTPELGFSLVGNIGGGQKYPYNPYYGEFSPRVSFAWNPHYSDGLLGKLFGNGKTVLRGGYARIFGRLNGVDLVLVPLLGPGLLQGVTCVNPLMNQTCAGSGNATPANAFRIGTDGLVAPLVSPSPTLAQPFYPGGANPETVDSESLDPNFKPDRTDNFTFTVQRELNSHVHMEVGYIGKIIKNEYMQINLDAVPTMETLGGQTFANAYAQVYEQMFFNGVSAANVTSQPFFESALGGSSSAFCKGYSNCTVAVASNYASLIKDTQVADLFNKLQGANGWQLGRVTYGQPFNGGLAQSTSLGMITSAGYGNYNALFVSVRTSAWHGLTANSNFTWGRALGTVTQTQATSSATVLNPYNINADYSPQSYDYKAIYNLSLYYDVPVYKGQKGVLGHILGGWTISPLFSAISGAPNTVGYSETTCTGCQAFGEVTTPGTSAVSAVNEGAVGFTPYTGGNSANYNIAGGTGTNIVFGTNAVGTKPISSANPALYGLNQFQNPGQIYGEFRPCVLGLDTSCAKYDGPRGLPTWNLDTQFIKDVAIYKERVGTQFFVTITNITNHFQPGNGGLTLTSNTSFGQITSQANNPRSMEFGVRIRF